MVSSTTTKVHGFLEEEGECSIYYVGEGGGRGGGVKTLPLIPPPPALTPPKKFFFFLGVTEKENHYQLLSYSSLSLSLFGFDSNGYLLFLVQDLVTKGGKEMHQVISNIFFHFLLQLLQKLYCTPRERERERGVCVEEETNEFEPHPRRS